MSFNLATILRETALATPDATVHKFMGSATTYGELDAQSGRFAAGLLESGLQPGQVVGLQLPNVPQFLVAYFGTLKAGMTLLPLNPLLKAPEIEYHLSDSAASVMIGLRRPAPGGGQGLRAGGRTAVSGQLQRRPAAGRAQAVRRPDQRRRPVTPGGDIHPTNADDTAVLIYTSGTTGKPKGAELTHFQLYMNCSVSGRLFGAQPDDVTLAVLPFFHVFGLSSIINVTVLYGGCLSIVPRFEPKARCSTRWNATGAR